MNKQVKILIVGHNDIIENSLYSYFQSHGFKNVYSSSALVLDAAIQSSVYEYFQRNRPEYVFLSSTRSGGIEVNQNSGGEFLYHNLESQNNILYAAQKFGVKKLLYYGSSCVYPRDCFQPMAENMILTGPLEETSEAYAVAKIAGIKLCQSYRKQYGFNAVTMIPATVYGPGSDVRLETAHVLGALIARFTDAVSEGKEEVVVWGTGEPRREFLYVDDFVSASLFCMEKYKGEDIINAGVSADVSIKELAEKIAETVGFKGKIVFDPSKTDGVKQKLLDSSKLQRHKWKPKVSLKDGLAKIHSWYMDGASS